MLNGEINNDVSNLIIAELLYLNALNKNEMITIYINSPGGEVSSGLAIYDVMKTISNPIQTIGVGICASMAAVLLSSGSKGLRKAYQNCEIMIHQPLGGYQGQVSDMEIMSKRYCYLKDALSSILSLNTSQNIDKIKKDTDRDYFMSSFQAKDYHLIDEVIINQNQY